MGVVVNKDGSITVGILDPKKRGKKEVQTPAPASVETTEDPKE